MSSGAMSRREEDHARSIPKLSPRKGTKIREEHFPVINEFKLTSQMQADKKKAGYTSFVSLLNKCREQLAMQGASLGNGNELL